MTRFPAKKSQALSTQSIGSEIVVFNETTGKAICLNQISAVIWDLCDGRNSIAAIAEGSTAELRTSVSHDVVRYALRELLQKDLLEAEAASAPLEPATPAAILSRRALVQRLGGSAALLLPIVGMVAVPKKAAAYGGGCVLAETPIHLAHGGFLRADQVQAGMWLRSFDADSCRLRDAPVSHVKPVTAPAIHTLMTDRGDVLRSSPSHLLIAGHGDTNGTRIDNFRAGDSMLVYDAAANAVIPARIAAIQISSVPQIVYAIEMASDEHTLVTAGVVSHNKIEQDDPGSE